MRILLIALSLGISPVEIVTLPAFDPICLEIGMAEKQNIICGSEFLPIVIGSNVWDCDMGNHGTTTDPPYTTIKVVKGDRAYDGRII
jgi:hypothetical protein